MLGLVSRTQYHEHFRGNYLCPKQEYEDTGKNADVVAKLYPESKGQLKERTIHITKEFVNMYSASEKSVMHVVVTHGKPALTFSRLHGGVKKELDYCGMSTVVMAPQLVGTHPVALHLLMDC